MEILTPEEMNDRLGTNRKCVKCGEVMRHKNHSLDTPGHHAHEPLRPVRATPPGDG